MAIAIAASMSVMLALSGPAMAKSALAQKTYTDSVQGFEYAAVSGQSASFLGQASGKLPGVMNATITYTGGSPGPNVKEAITGGNWVLSGRWGRVFGSFSNGTVQWNPDGTIANVTANLLISGGKVKGKSVSGGQGTFEGALDHRPLAQGLPPTVSGTLQLTIASSRRTSPHPHQGHRHHKGH
jgi:hypothetical protein